MTDLFQVIHEDRDLLVVNKPADLVCHPTKADERSSLIGRVRLHLGNSEGRLVNRLDRETSGLVLLAKSGPVTGELAKLFESSTARKEYDAIVHGWPEQDEFSIDAPLGKDDRSIIAIKDCVRADGAASQTHARVVRRFARGENRFALLRVMPRTGRKHQIRIHLAHAGHSIVGDKMYGSDELIYLRFVTGALTDEDRIRLFLTNHALHAARLSFNWRGREWSFEAPVPAEFSEFASP
ncbi:MAG TPA: RluA family pseudouridine synthase [Candidatus Acidoferrum sp.]|nr:RluA family pseudouridine synthase [Candidatus Acidoferrum sp.]